MSPLNTLRTALRGIGSNVLRTALTTLGIIIGVASVIATLALGNGARAAVDANFRFLGSDQIQIETDLQLKNGQMQVVGKTLTFEDGLGLPNAAPLVARVHADRGNPVYAVRGTGIPCDKSDQLAVLHSLQSYHFGPGQHGDKIQQGPGILFEAGMFKSAQRSQITNACSLNFHPPEIVSIKK